MNSQKPSKKYSTDSHSPRSASQLHRLTMRPVSDMGATFISPIERWADNNYAPQPLEYIYTQNTTSSEIMAPLHGFEPQDVHITITRDHVIILLSHIGDITYPARQEFYCEVPLPPGTKGSGAYVVFTNNYMSIRLGKKQTVFNSVSSLGHGFKNGLSLLFEAKWIFGWRND